MILNHVKDSLLRTVSSGIRTGTSSPFYSVKVEIVVEHINHNMKCKA